MRAVVVRVGVQPEDLGPHVHDPHHDRDGPDVTVRGVVPECYLQGVQPLHLELAQLVDGLDLAVLQRVLTRR
jgi:hypothetical protein